MSDHFMRVGFGGGTGGGVGWSVWVVGSDGLVGWSGQARWLVWEVGFGWPNKLEIMLNSVQLG